MKIKKTASTSITFDEGEACDVLALNDQGFTIKDIFRAGIKACFKELKPMEGEDA